MSFHGKLFTAFALMTILFVAGSIVVLNDRARHQMAAHMEQSLATSPERFDTFQRTLMRSLITQAANMSMEPSLRGTLATEDLATIRNAAEQVHLIYGTDLFWILDERGTVLHRVETPQRSGDSLADRPLIRDVRNGYDSGDIWLWQGELYQVAAAPILSGGRALGILVIGQRFESWLAESFSNLAGLEVAFLTTDSTVIASSDLLPKKALRDRILWHEELVEERGQRVPRVPWTGKGPDASMPPAPTDIFHYKDGSSFMGAFFQLENAVHENLAAGCIFRSLAPEKAMRQRIQNGLLILGGVTILLALLVSYIISRTLTRPINRLVQAADRLASGDMETRVEVAGRDEIATLGQALENMRRSLKEAREELIRNERLSTVGRMASSITHDFRQPITAIHGYVQLLAGPGITPEKQQEFADIILHQIQRMQGMITELLDYARGEINLQKSEVMAREFLDRLVGNYEHEAELRKITINSELAWDGPVLIDRSRIERGVDNLVVNAMQAIEHEGGISLTSRRKNGEWVLTVQDDGPGIPEEIRENLFDAFVTHGKKQGTGLGLAVVKKVIEEHGGSIEVDSEVGQGTVFTIRLPLDEGEK